MTGLGKIAAFGGGHSMNLKEIWTEMEAVPLSSSMNEVFDLFRHNREWPFLPVVDGDRRVVGVVREYDLKGHAYAQFGRDLVKRHSLHQFLKPALILPADITEKELLDASAKNPNPDGVVFTEEGRYRAVLLNQAVLQLFEQQHLETEVRLAQAQKMEAIGTLAGGIAHDLNNILTPILGYAELMSLMLRQGEPINQEMIDQITVSATRAREIVKQILAFSRHQKSERCPVSLSRSIKETIRMISSSLPATIDIEIRLNVENDTVLMNPDEMHRVIMNLCTNAYHAMRERGGQMQITLDHHQGPLLGWSTYSELLLGDYLRLSVADTGGGIEPDLLPRIFEPFFTTKKQGEGTGLGLPIVHGIVSRSKGLISVESRVGKGSTFHLYFPVVVDYSHGVARRSSEINEGEPSELYPVTSGSRILFVDDEFSVTRLASIILPRYGIAVVTENDSRKALAIFRECAQEFDLLVTDQTMPGLTGVDLAREVLLIRPDLPVIMCTGYSEAVSPEEACEAGVCEYVLKPPDFQKLASSIRRQVCLCQRRSGMSHPSAGSLPHRLGMGHV